MFLRFEIFAQQFFTLCCGLFPILVDCAVCCAILVTYATLVALVHQSLLSWWVLRTVALWDISMALEDRSGPINRLHYILDMLYCISKVE